MKCKIEIVYLVAAVLVALSLVVPGLSTVGAQTANRAGLVVRFGDGSVVTRCIEFGESEISGYDVLTRSGLNVTAAFDSGMGAAVCKIEGEGCPVDSCLTCDTPNYWSYWRFSGGSWSYNQAGSSTTKVRDGDVEGWSWGSGDAPPVVPFDQICAPPPTDTPLPTNTPLPPTDTPPPPTATPTPEEPTATSLPPAPEVWFRVDENPIPAGSCTTLRWDTSNAEKVYLDETRVDSTSSREVCPAASQEYRLRVVGVEGEQTETLTLGVTGTALALTPAQQVGALSGSPAPTSVPPTAASQPTSPTLEVESTPAAEPSPTARPPLAASSSPSPTPLQIALAPPSSTPTRAAQPSPDAERASTAPQSEADDQGSSPGLLGYIVFNFLLIGLFSWLIFRLLQRK